MASGKETILAIREAIRISPGNIALRKHLADLLLDEGELDEAEKEYRSALADDPDNIEVKLGLAKAFFQQEKSSAALVILEELTRLHNPSAEAFLLSALLFHRSGDKSEASQAYREAVKRDPTLFDPELEMQLEMQENMPSDDEEMLLKNTVEDFDDPHEGEVERPQISFDEVGGMDRVKEEVRMKIIHPLEHPEIYKAYGKKIGGGILMYGPPGCGKTHLARATAGEVSANFISVGLHDVLNMYIGQSENNLHELFELARTNKPCVLFFDEVDALGASRSDMRQNAGRQLINQFLAEMDGVNADNEGVLILAATNAPWHLDSAFRRPGRFDRIIFVPPPDQGARSAILEIMLKDKPSDKVDYQKIARKTDGFSGADLKAVVDIAVEAKLNEAMKKGIPTPLTTKDLLVSAKSLKPTTPRVVCYRPQLCPLF